MVMVKDDARLPQHSGLYLWYTLSVQGCQTGVVTVRVDTKETRERLLAEMLVKGMKSVPFFLYQTHSGRPLTMYLDSSQPPRFMDGCPCVDDFVLVSRDTPCDHALVALANLAGGRTTPKASRSPESAKTVKPEFSRSTGPRFLRATRNETWTSLSSLISRVWWFVFIWVALLGAIYLAHTWR